VISSAVEHCLHTAGVTCSIHVSPTSEFSLCHRAEIKKGSVDSPPLQSEQRPQWFDCVVVMLPPSWREQRFSLSPLEQETSLDGLPGESRRRMRSNPSRTRFRVFDVLAHSEPSPYGIALSCSEKNASGVCSLQSSNTRCYLCNRFPRRGGSCSSMPLRWNWRAPWEREKTVSTH
jgi:hypothetical protein